MSPLTVDHQAALLVRKIVTLRSNPHYRVADIFYSRGFRHADSAANVLTGPEFDGTILKTYLQENAGYARENLALLSELIDRAAWLRSFPLPAADEGVIHIRAGDVVQHDWFLQTDFIGAVARQPMPRYTIVTCFAFQEWAERGAWMFSEDKLKRNIEAMTTLISTLLRNFPEVTFDIVSHEDIDRDLAYMVNAAHFIPDRGGFSELIAELRRHRAPGRRQAMPEPLVIYRGPG